MADVHPAVVLEEPLPADRRCGGRPPRGMVAVRLRPDRHRPLRTAGAPPPPRPDRPLGPVDARREQDRPGRLAPRPPRAGLPAPRARAGGARGRVVDVAGFRTVGQLRPGPGRHAFLEQHRIVGGGAVSPVLSGPVARLPVPRGAVRSLVPFRYGYQPSHPCYAPRSEGER